MELKLTKSASFLNHNTIIKTNQINLSPNIIQCNKCKRNFHVDNYPGHLKYENEKEKLEKYNLAKIGKSLSLPTDRIFIDEHEIILEDEELKDIPKSPVEFNNL